MERTQLFDLMGELKLYGMKAAFDEIMATAVKRQHEPQRIVGDLLNAEISEKQARSIKYQLTIAKLPLARRPRRLPSSRARRSTRRWSTSLPAGTLSPSSATLSWSARNRHGQDPSGNVAIAKKLHPVRRPRAVLQRVRSRQPARDGDPKRPARPDRRPPHQDGASSSSTNSAICRSLNQAGNSPCSTIVGSQALRAHLDHRHHKPRLPGNGRASSVTPR